MRAKIKEKLIKWFDSILSVFNVEYSVMYHGTNSNVEYDSVASKEIEKASKTKKGCDNCTCETKITKTELKKFTKKEIVEKANELGLNIPSKLKKDDMIKEFLKQK